MCVGIVMPDETYIDTLGKARKVFAQLVPDSEYSRTASDELCLCPLDIEATARANGFSVRVDRDWGDYYLQPEPQGEPA